MAKFLFSQINVFSTESLKGNPVAVVHAAEGLNDEQMLSFARWTNLSETTFLLPPTVSTADYKLRIFTPSGELPFAGHPTLGSCFAWLCRGGTPKDLNCIVQECKAGLIAINKNNSLFEFAAPPLIKTGPLDKSILNKLVAALSLAPSAIKGHQWVDNGPGWCALLLESAQHVLDIKPRWSQLAPLNLGIVGPYASGEVAFEVRAFVGGGGYEDPVTGSLNASLAQWLIREKLATAPYIAAQGTQLQREGRIHIREAEENIWVGGEVVEVICGEVDI